MKALAAPLVLVALVAACQDPVQDADVAALGPELAGVPEGPLHRAGQPCLVCHGGSGPASSVFAFGGTLYQAEDGPLQALVGARVTMTGVDGRDFAATTNAVGNFYVPAASRAPSYPVTVALSHAPSSASGATPLLQSMSTFIGRDGSCADCHKDPVGPTSAGHIWLVSDPSLFPGGTP